MMKVRDLTFCGVFLAAGCALGVVLDGQLGGRPVALVTSVHPADGSTMQSGGAVAENLLSADHPENSAEAGAGSARDPRSEWQDLENERNPLLRLRKMHALLETMDATQAAACLRDLQRSGLSENQLFMASALIERWAEIDPQAALEYAQSVSIRSLRSSLLKAAAGSWAAEQPAAALDWLKGLPPGEVRRGVLEAIVTAAGKENPHTALKFVGLLPVHEQDQLQNAYCEVFKDWTGRNPAAATSTVLALSAGRSRENAMSVVAFTWASMDPQAALPWIERIPNEATRTGAVLDAIGLWAQVDADATANYLRTLPAGTTRDYGIKAAMGEMAGRDSAAALSFYNKLPLGTARDAAAQSLVQDMATQNSPVAAAAFVAGLPPGKTQDDAVAALAMRWGINDLDGAVAWASKLSGPARSGALRTILDAWSQNDPRKAAEYLLNQNPGGDAQKIIAGIAASESVPQQAIAWAQQMRDPKLREGVIGNIVEGLSATEPRAAAKYLTELSGDVQKTASKEVMSNWAQINPDAAARWVTTLPENELRAHTVTELIATWGGSDPIAAGGWLKDLAGGPSRDAAVGMFARQVASTDPEGAALWAVSIADPQSRADELENVCRRWMGINPDAARRWISQSNSLSEDSRNVLLGK